MPVQLSSALLTARYSDELLARVLLSRAGG